LAASDFTIYDVGAAQAVTGFEVLDLSSTVAAPTTAAAVRAPAASGNARRHFMLLFDLSFSNPTAILKARLAARDFVLHQLHGDDLVAVATYSLQQGPRLVVTFTPDRAQVARGIDTLGLHTPDEFAIKRDPLRFVIASPVDSDFNNFAGIEGGGNSAGSIVRAQRDQMLLENMKAAAQAADRVERQFAEARIGSFSRGMGDLAKALSAVPGRKQIVYFSEGFDSKLLLGYEPASVEAEQDQQNIQFGQFWFADSDNRFGNTQVQRELFTMLESFRRADCVVQSIDIGGLRADVREPGSRSGANGQEMLFYVANETGGELYRNANDFGTQLSRVLDRTEVTYVLTFQRSDLPTDGAYRRLKVEVKGLPVGGRVSARPGYYAPRPFKDLAPLEKSLLAGDGIASAVPRRDIDVKVLAAPFRANAQLAYVPVVLEVDGTSLLAVHSTDVLDAEIYVYASDAKGQMRDFFTQSVHVELPKARRILEQVGLKYYGHLDLAPGEYRLRVLVRNAQTGRTGVESLPLSIPAYSTAEPYLLPPLFMAAQQGWMMVRERSSEDASASVVYPFTVKGEPYVPAAHPVLPAQGRTDLCLVGYNLGHELQVEGQVLTTEGQPAAGGAVALVERTPTGVEGLDKLIATFDPAGLGAGDYVLQVAVRDTTNGNRELSSLPFTIR
ncbi:MAG TPA: VWA domain-containing protein, partial [Thermoanaerobaculia bacterium]|nr:VWA domain-containing protein [Thermoanaerobaculia bacterium]